MRTRLVGVDAFAVDVGAGAGVVMLGVCANGGCLLSNQYGKCRHLMIGLTGTVDASSVRSGVS